MEGNMAERESNGEGGVYQGSEDYQDEWKLRLNSLGDTAKQGEGSDEEVKGQSGTKGEDERGNISMVEDESGYWVIKAGRKQLKLKDERKLRGGRKRTGAELGNI